MRFPLGDVAVRARGLAGHLLSRAELERLAHSAGSGVLARALEGLGYWPAPGEAAVPSSTPQLVDAAIEHETMRRLGLLSHWLGERRRVFAVVFEEDLRRTLRILIRRLAAGEPGKLPAHAEDTHAELPRRVWNELEGARNLVSLLEVLTRRSSPYAQALASTYRASGDDLRALELSLDRAFARRVRKAAARLGGRLLSWVLDDIDLENAWSAIVGEADGFIEGGRLLAHERHAHIAGEPDGRVRRRQLALVFENSSVRGVFDDPAATLSTLESATIRARIAAEHRAARLDPIGASPILEVMMRQRAERADLRRINWGIAEGLPTDVIVGGLVATR